MLRYAVLVAALISGSVAPALAQQQTLNITLGGFQVRGEDARVPDDVIATDRSFLSFDVKDFRGPTIGGEWLFPIGNFIEGGAGVSFYRRTVPSFYTDFQADDGTEIEQELRLRVIPTAFTFRLLPLGQSSPVQPYIGAGIGIFSWRYSETGDFIDFGTPDRQIIRGSYVASGNEAGPIVLGGLRFAGHTASVGGEVRYQRAEGVVGDQFAGTRIDLGGWTYQFTLGVRF